MPALLAMVKDGVRKSLEFLRGEFDTEEEFESYVQSNINSDLEIYPKSLWYSLFTQSYFFFENDLNELCKKLQQLKECNISLSDFNGKGISRARKYLTKVMEVDFASVETEWNKVTILQKIRNIISHRAGNLNNSNHEQVIRDYFKDRDEEMIDENGYILINQPIVVDAADTFREFWLGMNLELFYD